MSKIERSKRFLEFIWESNQDFYDNYLVNLTEDELERFMEENPDFAQSMRHVNMKHLINMQEKEDSND